MRSNKAVDHDFKVTYEGKTVFDWILTAVTPENGPHSVAEARLAGLRLISEIKYNYVSSTMFSIFSWKTVK